MSRLKQKRQRHQITCEACGQLRDHFGNGWCEPCNQRWRNAGRPSGGPPPPYSAAEARRQEYADLLDQGWTREEAARDLGVTIRTARNYEAALAAQAVAS